MSVSLDQGFTSNTAKYFLVVAIASPGKEGDVSTRTPLPSPKKPLRRKKKLDHPLKQIICTKTEKGKSLRVTKCAKGLWYDCTSDIYSHIGVTEALWKLHAQWDHPLKRGTWKKYIVLNILTSSELWSTGSTSKRDFKKFTRWCMYELPSYSETTSDSQVVLDPLENQRKMWGALLCNQQTCASKQ